MPVKQNKKNSRVIGFYQSYSLEEELTDTYYLATRVAIEKKVKSEGMELYRVNKEASKEKLKKLDGLICLGMFNRADIDFFKQIGKPCVIVDSNPDEHFDSVGIDFKSATKKALDHLYGLGHRKIAFIGGSDNDMYGNRFKDLRQDVFEKFLIERGIFNEKYVKIGGYHPEDGYSLLKELLQNEDKPTALFVANDTIAVGCYKAANEFGLKIPEDLSIVGFNDIASAQFMVPPLTTIKLYTEIMGVTAYEVLMERINTKRDISKVVTINTKLIERESTAKMKKS